MIQSEMKQSRFGDGQKIKLPNAIVAASVKFCELTLVSADAHVKRVEDIYLTL
jgi:hypothetical protein